MPSFLRRLPHLFSNFLPGFYLQHASTHLFNLQHLSVSVTRVFYTNLVSSNVYNLTLQTNNCQVISTTPCNKKRTVKMFQSILLNLLLVSFAVAEETVSASVHGNAWKYGTGGGLLGFVVLILDILVFSTFICTLSFPAPLYCLLKHILTRVCLCSGSPQV